METGSWGGPQSLSPPSHGQRGGRRAPRGGRSRAWRPFIRRNELFAVPRVGEDEPVIIFKFAIIDLGKSYCDKNELIIKFISEINSAAIRQLAADAGARAVGPSRRQVPAPRPGVLCGLRRVRTHVRLRGCASPRPGRAGRSRRADGSVPWGEAPHGPAPPPPGCRAGGRPGPKPPGEIASGSAAPTR